MTMRRALLDKALRIQKCFLGRRVGLELGDAVRQLGEVEIRLTAFNRGIE